MYTSSGDTGSGETGVNLNAHATGDPIPKGSALVTSGHTWLIVVGALLVLWLLGKGVFKGIRM